MTNRQERRLIQMDAYRKNKKVDKRVKHNPMTKENVMIIEFHDTSGSGVVNEFFSNPDNPDSPKIFSMTGYKVFAIYDNNSEKIAQYDHNLNSTDLTCLDDKQGYYLSAVSKNEYGHFLWVCYRVGAFLDEKGIVAVEDGRPCTEEESALLNEVYPEYLANAF